MEEVEREIINDLQNGKAKCVYLEGKNKITNCIAEIEKTQQKLIKEFNKKGFWESLS